MSADRYAELASAAQSVADGLALFGGHISDHADDILALKKERDDLLAVMERIDVRCPADSGNYVIASIGDSARNAIARCNGASS